ncbi:MAG: bifunctional phosphopantothenoylcysteine decarboxylase/phosphopantothenate--cysteine ligase CoaBC [Pseudomonadota bacterium]
MPKMLEQKTVVLGIGGGIAAYKCCELARLFVKKGAHVHCVLTKAGAEFVTPLTLQTLTANPVHTEMFNLIQEKEIGHISLADRADLVLVAPATADLIAKAAHGICDDLLTTVICATKAAVVFAPSMNSNMWENPITQENVVKLKKHGYKIIEPAEGDLACGYEGKGRLPEPEIIMKAVIQYLISNF